MFHSTDFAVLAQSIGETTIGYLGRETLRALAVEINPQTLEADVEIVLRDDTEDARRAALTAFHEVESIFFAEVVLAHNFVGELHDRQRAVADQRRQFQFA
ncbi:hypothetical protein DEI93_03285 [Curtobacterium sp. MCBD17_035]|uniref:hypothetical protein n=1 Tax=Curtobacterium sp. MCBD17_035 TaxID=2175673 RepID=UPI000DA81E4C|nr:hypothetical protein [Curtobacterium sp. MCBD17_035]WIB68081.1 hypothetical protein DEI93_03285 [Curtobacterium sp. MCBD17_035]